MTGILRKFLVQKSSLLKMITLIFLVLRDYFFPKASLVNQT